MRVTHSTHSGKKGVFRVTYELIVAFRLHKVVAGRWLFSRA